MSDDARPPGGDERKLATILFADLVGFTELASSQDAERTRVVLDRFYDAMADEIASAGGTVEKFAGDAVMAAFGVPVAQEDHVERALHAALAMRRRIEQHFGDSLSLRIGVNTGEVIVGRARAQSSFVTGDAVNVAARLEQGAEPGEILVGERAAALVAGAFEFEPPRRIEAKGKPAGVPCRRLVRALALMRPRGLPGLPRAFVGRDGELGALLDAYRRTAAGREAHIVIVAGEAGVGKTRLAREFWEVLGREAPGTLRRTGRCPAYGHALTYRPIGDMLKEHFGVLDSDRRERLLGRLGEHRILALALGLDVAGDLHPIVARDRLHDAWLSFVGELAEERPLVLLVEDLHWAEDPLLELLVRLNGEVRARVLVVGTGRPELLDRTPALPGDWIRLEPLAPDDVEDWLGKLFPGEVAPDMLRLLEGAEGNPLFLEELLAALTEQGALGADGRFDRERFQDATVVPESVQALLAARIDQLPPSEKAALQAASVIGRAFWPAAVRELADGGDPDLHLLEQRGFVRRLSGSSLQGESEFVFKHALTREVAYASLTRRDRARLHAGFASWLEQRVGARDEHAAALAQHYAGAAAPEDADLAWESEDSRYEDLRASAVKWLRRAAELAAARYEIDEALALLGRALALEPTDAGRIELLREKGRVHAYRFDVPGFRDAMEQALELGPERRVEAEIYARLAYYGLGRPYMWKDPPPREVVESWLARALELSEPGTEARGYAVVAQALADPVEHAEAAAESYAIGKALGDSWLVAFSGEARSLAATHTRQFQQARTWADRALEDARGLGDPAYEVHQNWNAGFVYLRAGLIAEAGRFAAITDRLAASLGAHDEVHAVALHAVLQSVSGDWEELAELTRRVEEASDANSDFPCQFNWRTLLVCALAAAHLGDDRETQRLEELGQEGIIVFGPPEREPALLRLALLRGDFEAAEQIVETIPPTDPFGVDGPAARLDALAALGDRKRTAEEAALFVGEPSYTRPFALRTLGRVREDPPLIERAAAEFEEMGLAWRADETRALLSGS
jgi:class 3 adenylate cyclase/tetratricopeptide (TPR) repeat protein